jgi:Na+-driven multidrug efflux pump
MVVFAKPILQMLFPNASSGEFIFQISSISIVFITLEQTINGALQGLGKLKVPVIALSIGVSIKLILNLVLVKVNPDSFVLGGVAGAAFATVMCHVISMFISLIALSKNIKIKFDLSKYFIKPIPAETLIRVLFNVRKQEYYNNPEKYTFALIDFCKTVACSHWDYEGTPVEKLMMQTYTFLDYYNILAFLH